MPSSKVQAGKSLDHTYRALADPSRRAMLRAPSLGRPLSVSDLAAPLPIGLPTVMKHLDVLARAGLIERRKNGRTVAVTLSPDPMAEAMRWLERTEAFWSVRLDPSPIWRIVHEHSSYPLEMDGSGKVATDLKPGEAGA